MLVMGREGEWCGELLMQTWQVSDEGLDNHVLLHHVEGHVGVGEMGRRPHQGRPENDC